MGMTDMGALGDKILRCLERHLLEVLKQGAMECEVMLRNRTQDVSFHNITGNLRSSLGTAVYDHGKTYFQSQFSVIMNGTEGSAKGKSMVSQLASQYADCVALVILAAEDYASDVEDRDSKDVISSVTIHSEQKVQGWIQQGIDKACKEINSWK